MLTSHAFFPILLHTCCGFDLIKLLLRQQRRKRLPEAPQVLDILPLRDAECVGKVLRATRCCSSTGLLIHPSPI